VSYEKPALCRLFRVGTSKIGLSDLTALSQDSVRHLDPCYRDDCTKGRHNPRWFWSPSYGGPGVRSDVSNVRASGHWDDADQRMCVLLRLRGLRCVLKTQARRLLRVLFLRHDSVSAHPAERTLLRARIAARVSWA